MGDFRVRGINDAVARICKDRARREGTDLQTVIRDFLEAYAAGDRTVVHHVDGDPNNHDPANLRIVPTDENRGNR
jgi:hypothetical protein